MPPAPVNFRFRISNFGFAAHTMCKRDACPTKDRAFERGLWCGRLAHTTTHYGATAKRCAGETPAPQSSQPRFAGSLLESRHGDRILGASRYI